jgi:predicted DNA binding CopG/RHH family protein
MKAKQLILDKEELQLLDEIESNQWMDSPLTENEINKYKESAKYTKSLQEKKQTTIRFSVSDLATIKAKAKDLGIGYQNIIQALVHNYATGKLKLEV